MFDSFQFYHYIKGKNNVLQAAGSSEKNYWKRKQERIKLSYCIMGQKEACHCYLLFNILTIC